LIRQIVAFLDAKSLESFEDVRDKPILVFEETIFGAREVWPALKTFRTPTHIPFLDCSILAAVEDSNTARKELVDLHYFKLDLKTAREATK